MQYIRFGEILENEKSKVWRGDIAEGELEGVSVYPAIIDNEGRISIGLTLPVTRTTLDTLEHLLAYDNRECYLVADDYIGRGTDNETLIKNVKIIKEIKYRYI